MAGRGAAQEGGADDRPRVHPHPARVGKRHHHGRSQAAEVETGFYRKLAFTFTLYIVYNMKGLGGL